MMEHAAVSPIVTNDHQSSMYSLVGAEKGPPWNDPTRTVRGPGGDVRAVRHRTSATARGKRSYGGAGSHPGGELALFIGPAGRDHPPRGRRGSDRLDHRVDRRADGVDGDCQTGPSGAVRGTNHRVPRLDVVRSARSWLRCREPDRGGPPRAGGGNAVRIETWTHASLIDACNDVTLVTGLHDAWIRAGFTHVTRPVRG
jgi:hypothetical protein